MAKLGLSLFTIAVAASFVACPLSIKKKGDGGDGEEPAAAPDAATVAVSGTGAKNEANVLRYANETPIANEPAVVGKDGAVVRNFPGNGPVVATLAKGTTVAKVAAYFNSGTLIVFDDPSGDGSKLLGWVTPKALDAPAPAPTKSAVVPRIATDAAAPHLVVHDAGTVAHDAGAHPPTSVDAGGGGGGGGSTLPKPPLGAIAVPPVDGKCPDGWALTESMCRRKCAVDKDCPSHTKCVNKGTKVCSSG
jgi:hypothetical protein